MRNRTQDHPLPNYSGRMSIWKNRSFLKTFYTLKISRLLWNCSTMTLNYVKWWKWKRMKVAIWRMKYSNGKTFPLNTKEQLDSNVFMTGPLKSSSSVSMELFNSMSLPVPLKTLCLKTSSSLRMSCLSSKSVPKTNPKMVESRPSLLNSYTFIKRSTK